MWSPSSLPGWVTKRVYQYVMRRLLRRIPRNALDLEQLEVQLGLGTIELRDVPLDTDYLNEQLGVASLAIKEGSVGSVRAKIPWKFLTSESCEFEVDELKVVVVPRFQGEDGFSNNNQGPSVSDDIRFVDNSQNQAGDGESGLGPAGGVAYMGVDDGVRMVAKIVERLLLSLRVKVTNMIIVFEEQNGKIENCRSGDVDVQRPLQQATAPHSLLIARVANVEYGVETPHHDLGESVKAASGTEPSMLVKVIKFSGATVELVDVQDEIMQLENGAEDTPVLDVPLTQFIGQPTFVLVGENAGLAGSIQLSVPWQDGTIDVPKFHADFDIGLVKMKLSPHHIQQLLGLIQAFIPEGGAGGGASQGPPVVKSTMANVCGLGSIMGSRGQNVSTVGSSAEVQRMFPASMSGESGRGVEEGSSTPAFLPVTRFIADWVHWAGNEGQRKDVAVAEADLAASVDVFFDCFDGTRSSQASVSSSGMWNWTRSAFSAITAASTLASGSIVLSPDTPKQPEYSMKAKVQGLSLDLYYDCTSMQTYSLMPTQARELHPVKKVSRRHARNTQDQISQEATGSEGGTEECLQAELSELNLSVTVSGGQTEFIVNITDLDVSELVLKDASEEGRYFEIPTWQSQSENSAPDIQLLQASIENVLPPFPASLAEGESRFESGRDNMSIPGSKGVEQEQLIGSQPLGQTMASRGKYDYKQLLRVLPQPEYSARVKLTWQSPAVPGGTAGKAEIAVFLQPLVVWLDVHTLKRIEGMMQKIKDSAVGRKKSDGPDDFCHNTRLEQALHILEQKLESAVHNSDVTPVKENAAEGGPYEVKLFAPCVRVITCFPVGFGPGSSGLQKDFIALDLSAPASKLGSAQPIVDFSHLGEKKSVRSSLATDTLLLRIGDIAANLVSRIDESHNGHNIVEGFGFAVDEILLMSQQDSTRASLPSLDRKSEQGASVEFQWHGGTGIGPWIAKRAWDGVVAQQSQGDGGRGIGGSNSEFAAATTAAEAVEEENSQLRKELLSCSSSVVRVNVPQVKIRLSEPHYTRVLELVGFFIEALLFKVEKAGAERTLACPEVVQPKMQTSDVSGLGSHPSETLQTSVLVQCGHVDIALYLKAQNVISGISKQGMKDWDVIRLNLKKLQVLSVLGIGGIDTSSYFWVHHEDCEVTGSFLADPPTVPCEEPEMLLLSCKQEALGRGDGGGGNALAAGKAGVTITHMVWPRHEQLGDALLTGTLRGITVVAHSGRLDWISAIWKFFTSGDQMESSEELSAGSGLDDPDESRSTSDPAGSLGVMRMFFLLDFHDVAFCYEPGSEAMSLPGVRPGRDSLRRGTALSSESSQILAPVACVVAAAAVRVSSSVIPKETGEEYNIWLRDVALHLLDTALRKQVSLDYTTESMQSTGYVQIAKEAVMEALVRVEGQSGLQWEVECANNQLRFDTCHDTTAALGRLVAQLQQLFAPDIEQPSSNVNFWKAGGMGSDGESPNFSNKGMAGGVQSSGDTEPDSRNLFEGVLEDAFSRVRRSWSSVAGDDVVDEIQGETFTVIDGPLHSRVSSMDRHEFLNRGKQDLSGTINKSVPSTPTRLQHSTSRTPSEESVLIDSTGLPTFIEDYYLTTQKHPSQPLGIIFSRQIGDSPKQSAGSSRNASRESTSSGAGREAEGKGVWYTGKGLEVVEDHVPEAIAIVEVEQPSQRPQRDSHSRKLSLPKKCPSSVGRLVLRDLSARWRLYGGSDWPVGRVGQDQKSPSESISEDSGRQSGVCLEVLLDGMDLQYDAFPAVGLYASRLVVSIRDIGVYDCSSDAPWRMVLGYYRSKVRPRESSSQAVEIEMDSVRPDSTAPLEEYRLIIGLLPIRLHLDQRHIDFCINFFSPRASSTSGGVSPDEGSYPLPGGAMPVNVELPSDTNDLAEDALLPFFQICELRPFTVRVDYVPRRVDLMSLRGGNYAELVNLVTWKGIELNLKQVRAAGVHGWSSLSGVVFGEWLEDIAKNQVHKFVRGVGPIRPLYAVGSGAAKLVVFPAEYYKKDRRLFRGMRKGAIAFLRSISLEALGLGAHLAAGAQEILQQTEFALGGAPTPTSFTAKNGDRRSRAVQPGDTREGLQQACESISYGLERTASSLVGNPLKVYQRGAGAGLAVASALRAAPAAAVAPASAAAAAVHRALLGVRNELDPEKKRESDEKHTGPPPDIRRAR